MPGTSCQVGGPFASLTVVEMARNGLQIACLLGIMQNLRALARNFWKVTPALSDEMSYTVWLQDVKDFMLLVRVHPSPFTPLCPRAQQSVCFLIRLHFGCISNAISPPSLSLCLLFALRKLKRNYYNLYYLQLSCPSELARPLFRLRLRLRRNAKVSSALGQEVTRAASADVVCFVVVGTRHDQVHKCMQTTCGNVEIYSQKFITCSSAPPKPPFLVPSPCLLLLKNFLKCVAGLDISLPLFISLLLAAAVYFFYILSLFS